jgi:hypothetical protein
MYAPKHALAAITLVAALGLVMPSTFGGSASADPKPGQSTTYFTSFSCEIGSGDPVQYQVVTQGNGFAGFEALDSTTVFQVVWDQKFLRYTAPDGSSFTEPLSPPRYTNQGQKLGQNAQSVPCHEYKPLDPVVRDGVTYQVLQDRIWHVIVSGDGQGVVKAASADHSHKHRQGGRRR